jgi:cytochrome c-type biogenesis protein CcmH
MNAVLWFLVWAALMCMVVVAVLAWSLRRASRAGLTGSERDSVLSQVAVYREHLSELQHELAQGTLDQAGFDASHEELTQRLLEDTPAKTASATSATPATSAAAVVLPRWKILGSSLALAVPLLSFSLYFMVGTPLGIDPVLASQVGGDEQISSDKLQAMADQLRQRLTENPNNAEGWVMMGRIERALGRRLKNLSYSPPMTMFASNAPRCWRKKTKAISRASLGRSFKVFSKPIPIMAMLCCSRAAPLFRKINFKTR